MILYCNDVQVRDGYKRVDEVESRLNRLQKNQVTQDDLAQLRTDLLHIQVCLLLLLLLLLLLMMLLLLFYYSYYYYYYNLIVLVLNIVGWVVGGSVAAEKQSVGNGFFQVINKYSVYHQPLYTG
jgi:hypothetical protein